MQNFVDGLAVYKKPEDLIGESGVLKQLTKLLVENALDVLYPIIYLDCIHVKVRKGAVRVKAVYLAIGITMTGEKKVFGMWMAQTEGAKFWLQLVTELRNRGSHDLFIACIDGLKGFSEAIEAVFPKATVQFCVIHMVRHSLYLYYVPRKRRKEVVADQRLICQSATVEEAELRLGEFKARWDDEYLPIGQSRRQNWSRQVPFSDYCPKIRKVIYTTSASTPPAPSNRSI